MSELKKDYTTPEQSKRLLELGIPIESANIIYYHTPDSLHDPYFITEKRQVENLKSGKGLPCWSVGRLIDIYSIITGRKKFTLRTVDTLINEVIYMLNVAIKHEEVDFSKLDGKYENLFSSIFI